jgi:hypothetical protein
MPVIEAETEQKSRRLVHIFQSYGWLDATTIAQKLKESLVDAGYDVWIDREHLREDDKHFSLALEAALQNSEVVVALLSPHSVRGLGQQEVRSSICYNELRFAEEIGRPIVPVRVQKFAGAPPFLIIKYRRIDWLDWADEQKYQRGLFNIIATIQAVLANDRNFDPDIVFQETNFAIPFAVARQGFVGRDWLFAQLKQWLEQGPRCLLIEGDAGTGKTAFIAELVRRNPGGRMVAYHFCGRAAARTNDATAYVKSTAAMIANTIDEYSEFFWSGGASHPLAGSEPRKMLTEGLLAELRGHPVQGPFYIVVDALDEAASAGEGQVSLPQLLSDTLAEFPDWLKLLVTSRPHEDIRGRFRTAQVCTLSAAAEAQRMDLRTYIEQSLAEPELRGRLEGFDPARAVSLIEDRAAGSFQYASSVLGDRRLSAQRLHELPEGLEELYFNQTRAIFPNQADFRLARIVLGMLLAAREPLTLAQLAILSALDLDTEVAGTVDLLRGFIAQAFDADGAAVYRIAHMSIAEWLLSPHAGRFRIDLGADRQKLLEHCRAWAGNRDGYALRHVVGHLLDHGDPPAALAAIRDGLFARRAEWLKPHEPRLDADDSRNLTLALIAARDQAGILEIARTENTWQRDGVAAALQSVQQDELPFIDRVVGALLTLPA